MPVWIWSTGILIPAGIAIFSLWAWWIGNGRLTSLGADYVPVAPSTALLLLLLSVAVTLHQLWHARPAVRMVVLATALLTATAACVVLVQYFGGGNAPWLQWPAASSARVDGIPVGRMSPFTAGVFLLVAGGLFAFCPPFAGRVNVRRSAAGAMLLSATFCGISALAYAIGAPFYYQSNIVPMAVLTATALTALCLIVFVELIGSWLANLLRGVQGQLFLGFGLVVVLLTGIALMAYVGLTGARQSQRTIVENNFANVIDLANFRANVNGEQLDMAFMIDLPRAEWGPWQQDMKSRATRNDEILQRLTIRFSGDPAEKTKVAEIIAARDAFEDARRAQILALLAPPRFDGGKADFLGPQMAHHTRMRELARELEASETAETHSVLAKSDQRARGFALVFVSAGGLAILGAIGVGFHMHRVLGAYVADRRRAEEALHRSAQLLRQTQEVAHVGGWEYDVGANHLVWTEETSRIHEVPADYDPNDVARAIQFFPGESRTRIDEAFHRAIRTGESYDMELQLTTARQRLRWVRTVGRAERENGRVTRVYGSIADITERKEAEAAVRESERRFRERTESLPQLVWTCLPDGRCDYLGRQWVDYTGIPEQAQVGYGWVEQLHPADRQHATDVWQEAARTGGIFDVEFRIRRNDGEYRWFKTRAVPLRDDAGHIVKWFGTNTDIEDLKRAQAEIRQLNAGLEQRVRDRTAELETANRELEAFAYSVSHDLRAPLRSIDGFSRVLLEDYADKLDAEGTDSLQRVRAASQAMGRLIDDLLALSRTARAEMRRAPADLTALANGVAGELARTEPERRVQWAIAPGLIASGDRALLRIVLENLMSNAWKFTGRQPNAVIEFSATTAEGARAFLVRDNGAGFDMAYANKLFGAFQRLHAREEFPGTGVGLATVQRIVHRHGGRVWATGKVDQGAAFYFTLPDPTQPS